MDSLRIFFEKLDRRLFLLDEYKGMADYDGPLPIGYGQTISQPSLVLEMTRLLDLSDDMTVLEIGTGSGYQTAFLAEFASVVYTVERIEELSKRAQKVLLQLGYDNIHFSIDDGSFGWKEVGPFDRIMVTAAAELVPERLVDQLVVGGKMLLPIGPKSMQELALFIKNEDGSLEKKVIEYVRFVEFVGQYGWNR